MWRPVLWRSCYYVSTEVNFFLPWAILKKQLICQWCERMYLCGFVTVIANKIEGTMSWCLGTNEILASIKHGIAKGRTTALLILHIFFVFYYGYRCLEALHYISSWFKRCVQWCSCLRVHILVWMLLQDISDRIRLSRTVQRTYLWVLFHLLQARV